jgi:redox-sensitive bicupin YhaK (pirin superfamily)
MKAVFHPAGQRGHNTFGWLDSHHSFSFGHFHDENKMHFGALRVLNDDKVMPGMGFGTHPHDNMEIVSIPLSGALEHRDSMDTFTVIKTGDVQIMSAGTGVTHSEYNHSKTEPVDFLQIWVFPRERQLKPRYDQKTFLETERTNRWQTIVDPTGAEGVQINQEAWFGMAELHANYSLQYSMRRPGNGVYLFVLNGTIQVEEHELNARDAMGIWETDSAMLRATADASILAIEVPMAL